MAENSRLGGEGAKLRRQAEDAARDQGPQTPGEADVFSAEDVQRALHELRVHQIELEMQNEELRRAEVELDTSRARYFDLYDLAPVGYCTVNEEGVILEANLTAGGLLGVTRGALVDRTLERFIYSEDREVFHRHEQLLLRTGEPQTFELRMGRRNEAEFWARLQTVATRDASGAPLARIVISDITVLKQAEAQLHQAQKMESIGLLAGGVAHDFNNRLTVINGYSQMLLDRLSEDDPMRADVAEIRNAGEHAAGLTRQLLAFSRKQVLQPRKLDLNRVVREMGPMLARLVGADLTVSLALDAESGTVSADPHQLEQVVLNLAVNARDAMPHGGKLAIGTALVELDGHYAGSHPGVRAGRYVTLTVSDNGVGMDEETRLRCVEPFFTTKGVGEGTGLGLSIVHGIVAQSGGHMEVHSKLGQGTTVALFLPALTGALAEMEKPIAVAVVGGQETILVVEDQPDVLDFTLRVLTQRGYHLIAAQDASEAIRLFEKAGSQIDLVLTDMVMPNMSGAELAGRLKEMRPQVKVLFMSGYPADSITQRGVYAKGVEFLQKPFSPQALALKVRAVLGEAGGVEGESVK